MEQGALPLEAPVLTLEQAMRAEFERLPRAMRSRGFDALASDELLGHCLALGARARLRKMALLGDSKICPISNSGTSRRL